MTCNKKIQQKNKIAYPVMCSEFYPLNWIFPGENKMGTTARDNV
uniref:Uncharacterized protein n=1 Tax=Rhizophora mucronata TaxID=61149 RepID=A0A2P2PPA0_RHIMU